MENHHSHHHSRPWTKALLSIDFSCEKCLKKLERYVLKMEGVEVLEKDPDENILAVSGTMDPVTLLNEVAKLGIPVTLLPNEKYIKNKKDHFQEQSGDEQMEGKQYPMKDNASTSRNRKHQKHSSGLDFEQYNKVEKEHKCEAYVPPKFDERVCRYQYCADHPRGRFVLDRVPEDKSVFGISQLGCNGYCGEYPCYDPYMYQGSYHRGMPSFGYNGGPSTRPFGYM